MNTLLRKSIYALFATFLFVAFSGCSKDDIYLHYALKAAGKNKSELKTVLKHYRTVDKDPEKLKAAKYLIANMPAHYSYRDTILAEKFYDAAIGILQTDLTPEQQRDSIRLISYRDYPFMTNKIVSDVKVMKADYLIYCIDFSFEQWRTRPWSKHLTFEEFKEWILPYKIEDCQSLDYWMDTLTYHFSDRLRRMENPTDQQQTIYLVLDSVRDEIVCDIKPRVLWGEDNGYKLLSSKVMPYMTYGTCEDYVNLGILTFRSLGLPAIKDEVPVWGRNHEGHTWFIMLSDRGRILTADNCIIYPVGWPFYPYERFPKIWRTSFTINRRVVEYRSKAKYVHPFELCKFDVTDQYYKTSDLEIELNEDVKLKDKYVYIAMIKNHSGPEWEILDFGKVRNNKAKFSKIGRNILYCVLGFDGQQLVPASNPFIVKKDGNVEYVSCDKDKTIDINLRRKYYQSYNVVNMRRRMLGGMFQCSDSPDFKDAVTLYTIEDTDLPYLIKMNVSRPYRYWRYMSPDDSWGSISEVSFHDAQGNKIAGKGIANKEAGQDAIERAYDGNLLSNFEINQPNGNWVGMDMGKPIVVEYASVSPRSDDNDICPGNEYELFFFNGIKWKSIGYQIADSNTLFYDHVPVNTLLWLRNYTRGNDERPFIIRADGTIEWW